MKRLASCMFLLPLAALSACNAALVPGDKSLISGIPCAPPCWQNLTPGISDLNDVESFIRGLKPSEQETLRRFTFDASRLMLSWTSANNRGVKQIVLIDNRVALIEVRPPEIDLRLGAVVEHFGAPEGVLATISAPDQGGIYVLELYYLKQGLAFESWPDNKHYGQVKPDMSVRTVYYFAPDSLENYFVVRGLTPNYASMRIRSTRPWTGFGEIRVQTDP